MKFCVPFLLAAGMITLTGCSNPMTGVQANEFRLNIDLDLEKPIFELDYHAAQDSGGVTGGMRNADYSLMDGHEDMIWDLTLSDLNLPEDTKQPVDVTFEFSVLPEDPQNNPPEEAGAVPVTPPLTLSVENGKEYNLKLTCTKEMACTIEEIQ